MNIIIISKWISLFLYLRTLASLSLGPIERKHLAKFFSTLFPSARFELPHTGVLKLWETAETFGKAIRHHFWGCGCVPGVTFSLSGLIILWRWKQQGKGVFLLSLLSQDIEGRQLSATLCTQTVLRWSPHQCQAASVILEKKEGFKRAKHNRVTYPSLKVWSPWSKWACLFLPFMLLLLYLKFYSSHLSSESHLVMSWRLTIIFTCASGKQFSQGPQ